MRTLVFLIAIVGLTIAGYQMGIIFPRDDGPKNDTVIFGPIFDEPQAYQKSLLADPWVHRIPVGNTTFAKAVPRQVRIGIDDEGGNDLRERTVRLETPTAVALFEGDQRDTAKGLLHGIEEVLDEREGYVLGIALTDSMAGYEAMYISTFVESRLLDGEFTADDKRLISELLSYVAAELSRASWAWFVFEHNFIAIGPGPSKQLMAHIRNPEKTSEADGIFLGYLLRHEIEHAVTPAGDLAGTPRLRWLEEGTADTIARWPGIAAATAQTLGLPYPEKFETVQYQSPDAGYPPYVQSIRVLLEAADIDTTSVEAFAEADELLQGRPLDEVLPAIGDRIIHERRIPAGRQAAFRRELMSLTGQPGQARRLVARYT